MTVKAQIVEMLDLIPDMELETVLEVVRHFVPTDLDDIATEDDLKAHDVAIKEYLAGEVIEHSAIGWDK